MCPIAMNEKFARRGFRLAGWFFVITIAALSLSPDRLSVGAEVGIPKFEHLLAYLFTTTALMLGYARTRTRLVLCGFLIGFGGLMELGQAVIPGRTADWADVMVNTLGVGMGLGIAMFLEQIMASKPSGVGSLKPDTQRVGKECTPGVSGRPIAPIGSAGERYCSPPFSYRREQGQQRHSELG
jgi:VanZ family protein